MKYYFGRGSFSEVDSSGHMRRYISVDLEREEGKYILLIDAVESYIHLEIGCFSTLQVL